MNSLLIKGLLMWLLFAAVAITSGILREKYLTPILGSLRAHQAGTLAVLGIVFLLIYFLLGPTLSRIPPGGAWTLGLSWLGMTICFEFLFGHYVVGHSWKHLLADYNIIQGRLWGLFLVGIAIFPRIVQLLRASLN